METQKLRGISIGRALVFEMDLQRIMSLNEDIEDIQTLAGSKEMDLSRVKDRADLCLTHGISEFYQEIYEEEYNNLLKKEFEKEREKQNSLYDLYHKQYGVDILRQ